MKKVLAIFGFVFAFVMCILIISGGSFDLLKTLKVLSSSTSTTRHYGILSFADFGFVSKMIKVIKPQITLLTDNSFEFADFGAVVKVLVYGLGLIPAFLIDIGIAIYNLLASCWEQIVSIYKSVMN